MESPSKVTLKLLIDKSAKKVLFAEAGKEFIDFLCNILTLPVGTVISLLSDKQDTLGSLSSLYQSIQNLNDDYVQPNQHKDTILKPEVHNSIEQSPLLLLTDITPKKSETTDQLYRCTSKLFTNHHYVSNKEGTDCPACYGTMTGVVKFVEGKNVAKATVVAGGGGGFVKGVVTYMVMDDLAVGPMSTITGITLLNKFNVKDVGALEEEVVHLDMAKGLKLLKTSFQTKNVLTEVFLPCRPATY